MSKKNDLSALRPNKALKWVHGGVQQFPFLKEILKKAIQIPLALVVRPPTIRNVEYRIDNAFLGFHDVSPWNFGGDKLAVHLSDDTKRRQISENDEIQIGIYSHAGSGMEIIGSSNAFNWQQGSRLQWVGDDDVVSFNCKKQGTLVAGLWDCNDRSMKYLPAPVYSWSRDGQYWVSANFSAIEEKMPGYGYVGDYIDPIQAGTFSVWSKSNGRMICNIDLRDYHEGELSLRNANFFVSHFQFSPDGSHLAFFVRERIRENWFKTHFFLFDIPTEKLTHIDYSEGGSHFTWLNEAEILIYMKSGSVSCFQVFDVYALKSREVPALSGMPDGHPYENDGRVIIDTYPDIFRNQRLYIYDPANNHVELINVARSPIKYTQYSRIDMHPKVRFSDGLAAFDSGALNRQSVFVCKV